ncbi:hypothetical protein GCM10023205_62730 [Yinghuangia aomiensis]|uniref:Protease inhibitor Inh n=1 Tax=Yinghuangia aomiensis TaxID=676205 RepID=A0ABP9I1L0_9ACTN
MTVPNPIPRPLRALGVAAALLLAGTACSGGGGGGGKPSASIPVTLPATSAPPSADPSASAGASGPSAQPSATSARPATTSPTRAATTAKPRTSAPAGGPDAKFQGLWYYSMRDQTGGVPTLTVRGSTISVQATGLNCSGSISTSAYVNISCKGDTGKGQASVSADGKTLTIAWTDTPAERFQRTKP